MANKLTLSRVKQIIDNHLESEINFMFVCNFDLAHCIYDYLHNDYGIVAESLELNTEIEEYYLSITFYPKDNEICLICENAKCLNGKYKCNDDNDWIDYFIFTDINRNIVDEKLCGEGSWSWCELVDDEDEDKYDCNECNCQCDEELSDEEQAEINLIEEYAEKIEQSQCECGCDLRNTLYDLFWVGRRIGFSDCKDWLKEVLN